METSCQPLITSFYPAAFLSEEMGNGCVCLKGRCCHTYLRVIRWIDTEMLMLCSCRKQRSLPLICTSTPHYSNYGTTAEKMHGNWNGLLQKLDYPLMIYIWYQTVKVVWSAKSGANPEDLFQRESILKWAGTGIYQFFKWSNSRNIKLHKRS